MTYLIVETTYDLPLTDDQRQGDQDRLYACMALRDVRWVQSFESADRKRKICLFEGPDAEALRESLRSAHIPFDRVWNADWRRPEAGDLADGAPVSAAVVVGD
ncbi:MAG: nickel-binding protein [Acidobacteriota bacterium]